MFSPDVLLQIAVLQLLFLFSFWLYTLFQLSFEHSENYLFTGISGLNIGLNLPGPGLPGPNQFGQTWWTSASSSRVAKSQPEYTSGS